MKGQFNSILEGNVKLKLIQVNCYGISIGVFQHFFVTKILSKQHEILSEPEIISKNVTVRTVIKHIIFLKYRPSKKMGL